MRNFFLIALFLCATLTFAQGKKTYDVGILLDNRTAEINPLLEQLENQIKVVVGQDANINFSERNILVNNYDLQKAEQHYNTLLQNETDIILAFGVMNSVILNKQSVYVKPTILFGAINQDVTGIDLSKKTSEINNFTYLIESRSYKDDLKRLKELTNFKKVGIIIERQLVDVLQLQKAFDPVVKDLDAAYTIIPFSSVADITNNLTDVDAVYIAGGVFLKDEEVKELAKTFIGKKLPSNSSVSNFLYFL